ncbi:MAG: GTPase HflX, partial [Planctomycetota bacterium]
MSRLAGNLHGLKPSQVKNIERLLVRRSDRSRLIGVGLARELGELAWSLGRNVGVLLDRAGHVKRVLVGDMHSVPVPADLGPPPQPGRLKGLRLVRTELAGRRELADIDREQLLRHRLDALARLELDELGEVLWVRHTSLDPAHMGDADPHTQLVIDRDRVRLGALSGEFPEELAALEEEIGRRALGLEPAERGERAVLIVVHDGNLEMARMQMRELCELARSALLNVVGQTSQRREKPDPRTYVGRGKVAELCRLSVKYAADQVVVGNELSGVQLRNLEDRIGVPVVDRTELVLRIFERRAETRAARLRVALARLRYQLPRIVVQEHGMSRIARGSLGGAGTRGKGEPYLELSRRRMRERIHRLESILERVARQQRTGRRKRGRSGLPICALVGYTNAGKSSWLNALTDAEAGAESLLFAT